MASIPLPALHVNPPQQQDPLEGVKSLYALKSLQNQQALQQQQLVNEKTANQGQQQEIEQRDLQLKASKTLAEIGPNHIKRDAQGQPTGYNYEGLINDATSKGIPPTLLAPIQAMQKSSVETVLAKTNADKNEIANQEAINKQAYERLEGLKSLTDPAQRKQAWQEFGSWAQQHKLDVSNAPAEPPDNQTLTAREAALGMHAQALSDAKTQAETNQANEKANLDKMEAQQKGSPLTAMEQNPAAMAGEKLPSAMAYLESKIKDPATDPKDVVRATKLLSTAKVAKNLQLQMEAAKKATDQAITDGDPMAAGHLLASGVVSPSQIISTRKPDFATKAFTAASKENPQWNPQKAEADFKVASSPANVAFFGSARSLTDKGGTLDQLNDAAKDLPKGQIPVFNSIGDAIQAATGQGPVAKYAAVLLGVADDYSKVMGGGQGSDTSRTQALKLAPTNASPEARSAAIEGIRGSVHSQINSRIGNNTVLKRMYGEGEAAPAPSAAGGIKIHRDANGRITGID